MGKKLFYNVILNLGIVATILMGTSALRHSHYGVLTFSVIGLAIFIWLKLRLLKQVKQISKKD